ncbi:MAG: DUF1788 domain-containing protein [Candidatus Fermentibacteraceae bacterium]|nr:DUF1788 domain-containing protein [Candidatus Fermentibacteraceae bacterium]
MINEKFQHLLQVISNKRFLQMQGLGKEVPFFICPYEISEDNQMRTVTEKLKKNLDKKGIRVLEVNLYDLSVAILKDRGIWDQIIEQEHTWEKEDLLELLQGPLDPETYLVPAIAEEMQKKEFDVLFLTGVGEVFPYIRSHNLLNNLQSTAKEKPTLLFFPGEYNHSLESGASLNLFNKLPNDKYYRAFNILQYEV